MNAAYQTPPSDHRDPRVGDVLLGSFKLMSELGRGSFALCYLADQLGTDRQAVVKIAHSHLLHGPFAEQTRDRFAAEFRASTRVSHPNLATIYTAGETPDGRPAIAMEYIEGVSLLDFLQDHAPLPRHAVGKIFGQLLSALTAVHDADIVHRDVTPNNIIITPDERVILLDFGVARMEVTTGHTIGPIGTPRYMAPEQIEGHATPRSDMFAFGSLLWWALTGSEYMTDISQLGKLLAAQLRAIVPPDPRELRSSVPDPMAAIIMRLLHPDARKRPASKILASAWPRIMEAWAATERSEPSLAAVPAARARVRPMPRPSSDPATFHQTRRREEVRAQVSAPSPARSTNPAVQRPSTGNSGLIKLNTGSHGASGPSEHMYQLLSQNPMANEMIDRFVGNVPEWLSEIEESIANEDFFLIDTVGTYLRKAAHDLGAITMERHSLALKAHASRRDIAKLSSTLEQLETAFFEVFSALNSFRQGLT